MAGRPGMQQIDIGQLTVPQLQQLSQQVDQELEFLTNSINQLKMAQGKFSESNECLDKVTKENTGKDILVPLTSSMYVTGQLSDPDNVMIDIGTGYYVEKTVPEAKLYFKRKIDYITKQIEKLQPMAQEKYRTKQAVMEVLQLKIQAQYMSQQQNSAVAKT